MVACLLAFAPVAAVGQPVRASSEAQLAAYEEFRRLFAENKFAEALPLAQRVVQLTEQAGPRGLQLPIAYNNLGVAQMRVGDLDAAEASFRRALDLLEDRVGIVSRRLIAPLAGLGAVHGARGNHALAADVLQRALSISRRANGLFNIGQLELLESLVEQYEAVGNSAGVERERRYAVQVIQQEYGPDDPRVVPTLMKLAEWYEANHHYALARNHWRHVIELASGEGGGRNAATILGLLAISRNHRLQFVLDPESIEVAQATIDPWTGQPDPFIVRSAGMGGIRLDREGEVAALQALATLEQTPDPPRNLLAMALTELGDWYITADQADKAITYYRRAWPVLAETVEAGEPNPLASPRPLKYRTPAAAIRSRGRTDVEVVATQYEFSMNIDASGEAANVTLLSGDGNESRAHLFSRELNRALFSPRFEDGEPVATDGYRFTDTWYEAIIAPAATAEGEPEDKAPGS